MIDTQAFYAHFGTSQPLGADEQLLLFDHVRVSCTSSSMTAIFESRAADERNMTALFAVSGLYEGCLPFLTRSGNVALQLKSEVDHDESELALACLDEALSKLDIWTDQ